jgi:DNA-binding response OmpR family regulator
LQEVVGRFTSYKDIPMQGSAEPGVPDLYADALGGSPDHLLRQSYTGLALVNLLRSKVLTGASPAAQLGSRWALEMSSRSLLCPSREKIPLTESEWSFASALKRHSPNKVDRRDLIRMMGYNSSFYERNRMDAMVRRLRHKILAITTTLNPIQTVHGNGYVWRE